MRLSTHSRRGVWGLIVGALLLIGVAVAPRPARAAPEAAPLLLITSAGAPNRFGPYLGEILRAEGVESFDTRDIAEVTDAALRPYPVVLLAEMPLAAGAAGAIKSYVAGGGHLIAMRPDPQLDETCGWSPASGTLGDGYMEIAKDGVGAGLRGERLQFHGAADLHTAQAQAVASLSQGAVSDPAGAAVTLAPGAGGGAVACWAYDLAQSVVLTRQGNPANADVDVDGDGVFRTIDLFQTRNGGAPWVDRDRIPIPQADEQMRLLSRLVEDFSASAGPLPRLWYFPDGAMTVLVLTGDAHANPPDYYQKELDSLNAHGGKITLYLSAAGDPSDATMQRWRAQGHEFGIHPYASKPDPSPDRAITSLSQGYDLFDKWFKTSFSSPKSRTARNHQVAWKGWTDAAEIAVAHGIALDANFYTWGGWLRKPDGTWPHGYVNGSGQPMRFARSDGTILPIYQQATTLIDEQLLAAIDGPPHESLDGRAALDVSRDLIDASLGGNYAALMTQFHIDTYGFGDPQVWAEGTLDYARSKGVPIWNADQWLGFTEARQGARFEGLSWSPETGRLSFALRSNPSAQGALTLLLPADALAGVTVDGAAQTPSARTIKGRQYAFVTLPPGNRQIAASYSPDAASYRQTALPIALSDQRGWFGLAGAWLAQTASAVVSAVAWAKVPIIGLLLFGLMVMLATRARLRPAAHFATVSARIRAAPSEPRASPPRRAPLRLRALLPARRVRAPAPQASRPARPRWPLVGTRKGAIRFASEQDFRQPSVAAPTFAGTVIAADSGAVSLRATLEDDFSAGALSPSVWTAGCCLIGMPEIVIADCALRITSTLTGGGFVRTIAPQYGGALDALVSFSAGEDQHFGWATPGFADDQCAIFSSHERAGTLLARTRSADKDQQNAIRIGAGPQRLRIEWAESNDGQDVVRYYVGGALVATHMVAQLPPLHIHLWNNTLGARPLSADWIRCTPYMVAGGAYLSCPIAAEDRSRQVWGPLRFDAATPPGTSIRLEARTSDDATSWSDFVAVANGATPDLPAGIYLQYCATLTASADLMAAPALNAISIGHRAAASS